MDTVKLEGMRKALALDGMEVASIEMGDMAVAHYRLRKGFDSGPHYEGLPNDMCPCTHWGYIVSGKLLVRTAEGDRQLLEAGSVFHLDAAHLADVLEDTEMIEFTPIEQFRRKTAHLARSADALPMR